MKIRSILVALSLLAFLSVSVSGFLYYSSLREASFNETKRQAATRAEMIRRNLSSFLSENVRPVKTLAGMDAFEDLLVLKDRASLLKANQLLDHFKTTLAADVCYLMDFNGDTIASSNRGAPDSFVGKNFSFRPYFQEAIEGTPFTYLALGTTSHKRGAYYSHPVYKGNRGAPIGIVVIKASIEQIEHQLDPVADEILLVTDPNGIIFISTRKDWLFKTLHKLPADDIEKLKRSLQFGKGPWYWTGIKIEGRKNATDSYGNEHLVHQLDLYNYQGWQVIHLYNVKAIMKTLSDPLIKVTGSIVLAFCTFVGLSVFLLYRRASEEIIKRRKFEAALRESEERYRSIYHKTPAMLHSIDKNTRLISVSDNWLEVMGYDRDEVIGQRLTCFFTPESKRLAEESVFPKFFKNGFCKDVPYRFVKKNKETMDVLLSAIGDRNPHEDVTRSLAVSIDVTERNRAEKALHQAKEELSRYSKDLEIQVQERTAEITRILHQLRRLSGSIMNNQEKERSAIARELHDELGQVLTATRIDLVWLADRFKITDVLASQRALAMCDLIDKAIEDVRGMAIRLRPGVLDDLGLVDALEWYTSDFEKRTGISCIFEHQIIPQIKDTVSTAAYRITQEALTNVVRHAAAGRVEVSLKNRNDHLVLVILDNGKGFNILSLSETGALGVAGMRERAGLVGGTLEVESRPDKGTRVCFSVSLDQTVQVAI
ncbi:cache domain-containing protein [Thermodesulfobacteriota bacterium]